MNLLVTGCCGFIGSSLVDFLLEEGNYVVGVDNFNNFYSPEIKRKNIKFAQANNNFILKEKELLTLTSKDIEDYNIEGVIHLAALPGVRPSFIYPYSYIDNNIKVVLNILDVMRNLKIRKGVFASSSSVYGNSEIVPFSETGDIEPISIYGATKATLEDLCRTYSNAYKLDLTCLRFFTCYGPRQRPDLAIHKFFTLLDSHKPVPMFGDGSMSRDYTHISDIAEGVWLALQNVAGFNVINIGNSYPVKLRYMIEKIAEVLDVQCRIEHKEVPAGDVKQTWADITKAKHILGWAPKIDFDTGIRDFLTWFKDK